MYKKVQLLMALRPGEALNQFEAQLATEGQRLLSLLPKGASHLRGIRLANDPTRKTTHAAEMSGEAASFEVVFEIGAPNADLAEFTSPLQETLQHLIQWVNPEKSAVLAGTEHRIIPGECPLLLVAALRRLSSLTSRQFQDHWLNKHAEVARRVPVLRAYRQFHADPVATAAVGQKLGFGMVDFQGAAQGYYRDLEDFTNIMAQPAIVVDAIEDEKRFIDHSRSVVGLYRIVWSQQVQARR